MRTAVAFAALIVVGVAGLRAEDEPTTPITRIVTVVLAADGSVVEGATVEAWGAPRGTLTRRTGSDGIARFEGVPREDVVFVARKSGYLCGWHEPGRWWWSVPEEDGDPDGDGVTRMKLALVPGTSVEGNVVSTEGGPVAGAIVEAFEVAHATDLWTLRGAPLWTATTDEDGRFRTTGHWPKLGRRDEKLVSAVVVARGPGWIREKTEIWPGDAGKQKPLAFRLHPAGEIHGVVVGANGEPAVEAVVHAYPPDHWAFHPNDRTRRDTVRTHPREMHVRAGADGTYSFPEASPGVKYRIFAELPRAGARNRLLGRDAVARSAVTPGVGVDAAGERVDLELRARRLGSLTVRLEPGGLERRHVELTPPPDASPWVFDDEEEDGVVTVAQADPGEWTIEADAAGWLPHRSVVRLEENESKTVTIVLVRGVAVSGVVVDDAGNPVADAKLYAYGVDPENPDRYLDGYEEARTGPDGRFRIDGLRPGPTEVSVQHETLRCDDLARFDAPADDLRFVLKALASLRFRLAVAAGAESPTRVRVTITRLDGQYAGTQRQDVVLRSEGAFTLDELMPGRVAFAVEAKGYAPFVTRLTIAPGVRNEPEPFELSEGFTLCGRVVDGAGRAVAGARVLPWGNEEIAVVTGADGTFALPHMTAGPLDLSVKAKGMAEVLLAPRVDESTPPLEITVRPGGLVRGTVRREKYEPPISIDFFPADAPDDNVSRWRVEVKGGRFSVRLPAGRYRVAARPATFTVTEGGEVTLDLLIP